MKKMNKSSKNILIVGAVVAGLFAASKFLGAGAKDGEGVGIGGGSVGGQDDYGEDYPSAVYASVQEPSGYYYPEKTIAQDPVSGLDTSYLGSYVGLNTGQEVGIFEKVGAASSDRFAFNETTGGFIDRWKQQSIDPSLVSNFEYNDFFVTADRMTGSTGAGGVVDTSKASVSGMSVRDDGLSGGDLAFAGAAIASNAGLQAGAKTLQSSLNSKYAGLSKPANKGSSLLFDPYGVGAAKSPVKGIVSEAVQQTTPKWAKWVSKASNFVPFLDIPIGAALDVRFSRNDENPIGWGDAFAANAVGEAAQLGITAAGAAVGGVGAIPAFIGGTAADIAATEGYYAARGKSSLFSGSVTPKKSFSPSLPSSSITKNTVNPFSSGSSQSQSSSSKSSSSSSYVKGGITYSRNSSGVLTRVMPTVSKSSSSKSSSSKSSSSKKSSGLRGAARAKGKPQKKGLRRVN